MIKRRKTRTINVGSVKIGSGQPIRIQSMTKTDTRDTKKTIRQCLELEAAGCEIVRVAIKDMKAAEALKAIKRKINIPLVADIHFDWRLAVLSIKSGADKIRINPGNIKNPAHIKEVIKTAKDAKIPIRIGLNSGSLPRAGFIASALKYIKLFEKENFRDIIISLKSSDVTETVNAYRKLAALCNYPFHLGVTAAGAYDAGIVKSSIGIGALLLDGIGDTVRVSLTGDPVQEVIAAKRILQALRLRSFVPEVISCPTCGRCQVNLGAIVNELEVRLSAMKHRHSSDGISIAVMGCEVNGPGEAKVADIGIAFGKNAGILFKKGKIVKKVKTKNATKELLKLLCAGHKP
ncbi:MAG: flavodoxin-dependent (E)-4-hydroxy-3-methylbut-2-enyl-diphosphate synthase [Candidatus Omnitrophica bacterium]|nr:flavodoxin-dependent (E)-4-hydroxy-3-methylbut-2-enyl-diphosphate synthase [Candidatus Omnitrophota bacterium]